MKVITIPYINSKGQPADYFYDLTNGGKVIKAGTVLDVSEKRAKELMGDNKLGIVFAELYDEEREIIEAMGEDGIFIEQSEDIISLEEMTRDELFELADKLGLKVPRNTKTINLINKIIEKQNS